jgi:Group II intron, maturase-specific domain
LASVPRSVNVLGDVTLGGKVNQNLEGAPRIECNRCRLLDRTNDHAASPKALKRISRIVQCWALHHRSDLSLTELAAMHNPCVRGWIGYYGHFYKEQLRLEKDRSLLSRWPIRLNLRRAHRMT